MNDKDHERQRVALTKEDKEEILKAIAQQTLVSAREIHQALPQYEEEELITLLNDDEFYNELARRMPKRIR